MKTEKILEMVENAKGEVLYSGSAMKALAWIADPSADIGVVLGEVFGVEQRAEALQELFLMIYRQWNRSYDKLAEITDALEGFEKGGQR